MYTGAREDFEDEDEKIFCTGVQPRIYTTYKPWRSRDVWKSPFRCCERVAAGPNRLSHTMTLLRVGLQNDSQTNAESPAHSRRCEIPQTFITSDQEIYISGRSKDGCHSID